MRVKSLFAVVVSVFMLAAASPVSARQNDSPQPGELKVIAEGLDNPRGIAVGHWGQIFVAEAGRGGDVLVDTPLGDSDGPICVGATGAISRIYRGQVRRVIEGLPSAAEAVDGACGGPFFGAGATGPHGVDFGWSGLTYSSGLGGTPAIRDLLAAAFPAAGDLGKVTNRPWRGDSTDLAGFEEANDPDQEGVDSNPYGVTVAKWRTSLATDAGGNSLLKLSNKAAPEVVAVFAPQCVPFNLGPNPIPAEFNPCGDQSLFPAQAVPTDVAIARDGDYLVTTLGGFPFGVGESVVYKVDARHNGTAVCSASSLAPAVGCEVFADGLTALVAIDVGRKGDVYVAQFADGGVLGAFSGEPGSDAGSVRVLSGRDGTEIGSIEGLTLPGGIAAHKKEIYITNFSVFPGAGTVVMARQIR